MSRKSRNEISSNSTEMKPYIKHIQQPVLHIPIHAQSHRSFVLTFDPGEFVCDLPEIVAHIFRIPGSGGKVGGTSEAETDLG